MIRGYEKLQFFTGKAHPCVNARRLRHCVSKSVGVDLQRCAGKIVIKSYEALIGMMCRR